MKTGSLYNFFFASQFRPGAQAQDDGASPALPASYPPALQKACADEFDYAAYIRGIDHVMYFRGAKAINDEWVHLHDLNREHAAVSRPSGPSYVRGIDVRVSDIIAVADAPFGTTN